MHLGFFLIATMLDFFELLPQSNVINKVLNKVRELNDFMFMTVMMPISMVNMYFLFLKHFEIEILYCE